MRGRVTDAAQGYIFLDAGNTGYPGAYFLNPKGDLLWFHPSHDPAVFNVRVQSYNNRPVLTYWQGRVGPPAFGEGKDVILNDRYQTIHTVTAGDGYQNRGTDLHEFTLGHEGSEGTAFVTIASPVQANLTSVGGPPNGVVFDCIIQEIDIATNKVIWEWHALGHVPITDTYARYVPGQPFDYFHLDSIQQLSNGHIIISARHTWAVYSINQATGEIDWELGGKHSSFRVGPRGSFEWQHDATLHNGSMLTVFDDNSPQSLGQSRGLELHISRATHVATLVHAYLHRPNPVLAFSQGSVQVLSNHDIFVGWGSSPHFSEYTLRGIQLFDGSFRQPVQSYRAYRFENWVGNPAQAPAIAVRKSTTAGHDYVYASWNGATRVVWWRVLGSSSKTGRFVKVGGAVRWSHFETRMSVPVAAGPYFEVQALNANRKVLTDGTSPATRAP